MFFFSKGKANILDCDVCGRHFSKGGNLKRHKLLHGPWVECLQCSSCGQKCSNAYNFNKHIERKHEDCDSKPVATIVVNFAKGTKVGVI